MKKKFLHPFSIHSSSRHEKHCQKLQRLFWLFQFSKNPRCVDEGQQVRQETENISGGQNGENSSNSAASNGDMLWVANIAARIAAGKIIRGVGKSEKLRDY